MMKRRIEVIPTVKEIRQDLLIGKTVIVIDVLRSTSTIITALLKGFKEVYPTETAGQALAQRDEDTLLVGERFGKKIPGFDLSNSPYKVFNQDSGKQKMIITTTNGTHAILKAKRADHILIGAFLNAKAVVEKALQYEQDITLLCAGTRDEFALEDCLCAGYMVDQFEALSNVSCSDFAHLIKGAYAHWQDHIPILLPKTTTGTRLVELGCTEDIQFCAQINLCELVPEYVEHRIIVHPKS